MKKILATAGIGAALAVGSLAGIGTANAVTIGDTTAAFSGPAGDRDAGAFWVDVHPMLPGPKWTMAKDAELVRLMCSKLEGGWSEGHLIADIANSDGTPTSQSDLSGITYVVHAAEWHYCPSYY